MNTLSAERLEARVGAANILGAGGLALSLLVLLLLGVRPELLPGLTSLGVSQLDGRPVGELLGPALLHSASRLLPALGLLLWLSWWLALSSSPALERLRQLLVTASRLPLFLVGYGLIIGVNRLTLLLWPESMPLPAFFALPLGNGESSVVRWGLEVALLVLADGTLGMVLARLRLQVERLSLQPFVLAVELNGGSGWRVLCHHLRRPLTLLALVSFPRMVGSLLVLEVLFVEPGAGLLLVQRLEGRDLPVLLGLLGGLFTTLLLLQFLLQWLEPEQEVWA